MSFKRKVLISIFALASLGLLAAGDCEFEVDDDDGWWWGPAPVVYEPVWYDPFYPCCYW